MHWPSINWHILFLPIKDWISVQRQKTFTIMTFGILVHNPKILTHIITTSSWCLLNLWTCGSLIKTTMMFVMAHNSQLNCYKTYPYQQTFGRVKDMVWPWGDLNIKNYWYHCIPQSRESINMIDNWTHACCAPVQRSTLCTVSAKDCNVQKHGSICGECANIAMPHLNQALRIV